MLKKEKGGGDFSQKCDQNPPGREGFPKEVLEYNEKKNLQ